MHVSVMLMHECVALLHSGAQHRVQAHLAESEHLLGKHHVTVILA